MQDRYPAKAVVRPGRGRRMVLWAAILLLLMALAAGCLRGREIYNLVRHGIATLHSPNDRDGDLIDDYTDMMRGARKYVRTKPEYDSSYFADGYPPEGRGVCTDVIWKAFEAAGYDFKAMVDRDIARNPSAYPLPNGRPDPNIDFRRVVNLKVFFERNALSLTTDMAQVDQWQPGDIVTYEGHVAMVSDRRNAAGTPYIIHHTGHGAFEEDALSYKPITGHYRWTGTAE